MAEIEHKTKRQIKIMEEGGKRLRAIKVAVEERVGEGVSAKEIDDYADKLIERSKGKASFKMVKGYKWATCVNVNEGIVHGIPKEEVVFKKGDVVSVDMGLYYAGFHTDTSFSLGINVDNKVKNFLNVGERALKRAITKAASGNRVYDISKAIEEVLKRGGYQPVRALVGHGIGRRLHEDPQIPCFTSGERSKSPIISEGAALAIEVMYGMGSPELVVDSEDGWTISMRDGKISALFEETVAVDANGSHILT